jgi:hypothetical protein
LSVDSVQPNALGTAGWGVYGYAAGNPTRWRDPGGHFVDYAKRVGDAAIVIPRVAGATPVFIGEAALGSTAIEAIAVVGISTLAFAALWTAAECLAGVPIGAVAGSVGATRSVMGFSCTTTRPPRTDTVPRPPIPTPCPAPAVCGDPDDEPDDPPPPPPDDDDPDCEESNAECIPLISSAAGSVRDQLLGDPRDACARLTPAQRAAVLAEPWLTRPFFGSLVHDGTAREIAGRLEYVGRGGGPDFKDRANPQCLTTRAHE